jgi:hypothetical protein
MPENPKSFREYLPEDILIPFFGDKEVVGVEIGVWRAEGSDTLLAAMPNLKLYSIDPWLWQKDRGYEAGSGNQHGQEVSYKVTKAVLGEYGDRSIVLRMKSDEAVSVVTEPLDFVWIDGDHNEDAVRRDIINWKRKLKPRSILCGHDWHLNHIKKVVRELLGEPVLGDDDIWYFKYEK